MYNINARERQVRYISNGDYIDHAIYAQEVSPLGEYMVKSQYKLHLHNKKNAKYSTIASKENILGH